MWLSLHEPSVLALLEKWQRWPVEPQLWSSSVIRRIFMKMPRMWIRLTSEILTFLQGWHLLFWVERLNSSWSDRLKNLIRRIRVFLHICVAGPKLWFVQFPPHSLVKCTFFLAVVQTNKCRSTVYDWFLAPAVHCYILQPQILARLPRLKR